MRKAFVACLVGLLAINGAWITSEALAQNRQQGKQKAKSNATRPPPPPAARCPDLGVGTTAFVPSLPGQAPLGANEIAVTYRVSNDGNMPFAAATVEDTKVALEYLTAAGPIRVAIVPAITTVNEEGVFVLSYGHAERGQIRAVLPPEAAGRRLCRQHRAVRGGFVAGRAAQGALGAAVRALAARAGQPAECPTARRAQRSQRPHNSRLRRAHQRARRWSCRC